METLKGFISVFMSAVSNCMLYSSDHASVDELSRKAFSFLDEFFRGSDNFEIMGVEDDLIINKNPVSGTGIQGNKLIRRLKRKGISCVDFSKGITVSELKRFIADISTSEKGIKSYPHIKAGVIDVHVGESNINRDFDIDRLPNFTSEQIEKVKVEYNRVSPFKKLHIAGFDEIITNFIMMFKKEINILRLLKPARSYYEYAYTHATNVAVLSMFQAKSLGIREDFLRDIGIAAILHDVGKLLIPREICEKKDSHGMKEFEDTELHPIYGAQYLAKIGSLTRLAPIVAFEHHFRYDGRGYQKPSNKSYKQHICSQIVAISDCFDTLRSSHSHGRALEMDEVLSLMRATEEGVFNPFLIENFVRAVHIALAG